MASGNITVPKIKTYSQVGPNPYATGGFVITGLTSDFSWVGHIEVDVKTRGVLPPVDYEIFKNKTAAGVESLGNGGINIIRGRYDKATMGNQTGLPSGVIAQTTLFAAGTTTGSAHTHDITHTHGAVTSATETNSGTLGVNLEEVGFGLLGHTHSFTVASLTATTSSTTHTHNRSFEYDHNHTKTEVSTTDVSIVEMGSTNLSGVTFTFTVYGYGKQ